MKTEYDRKQLEAELDTMRAKAKAYDEGQEFWFIFQGEYLRLSMGLSERVAKENWLNLPYDALSKDALDYLWKTEEQNGYTCRKVRACKEVEK